MATYSLPSNTVENMVFSAGLSALVSAVFNKGNAITMAAIGATVSLTNSCASVILKRLNLDAVSVSNKTGLPIELTASLQSVLSVILAERIVRWLGGPTFNVATSALIAVGLTILARSSQDFRKNIVFITVA